MTPSVSSALLRAQSDERLAALARDGSERAFEAIVDRYRRPLHRSLRRMLPAARVDDVLQQTLLRAWSGLRHGSEVRELRPWLYRLAHNSAVNALERTGYDYEELRESLCGSDGPEADAERRAVMRETLSSVAGLPARQRRALLETAVRGRPTAEVAREMGLSEGAFRQLVHRARTTVRSAATALTPMPAAVWAAGGGEAAGGVASRVAELAAGAGAGGVGAVVLKTGTAVVTAGLIAAGPAGLGQGGDATGPGDHGETALAAEQPAAIGAPRGAVAAAGGARRGNRGRGRGRSGPDRGASGRGPSDDREGARRRARRGPDDRARSGGSGTRGSNDGARSQGPGRGSDDAARSGGTGERSPSGAPSGDRGGSSGGNGSGGEEGETASSSSGPAAIAPSGSGGSGGGVSGGGLDTIGSSGSDSSGDDSSGDGSSGSGPSGGGSSDSSSSGSSTPGDRAGK